MKPLLACLLLAAPFTAWEVPAAAADYLSPSALVAARDGNTIFVACATARTVLRVDTRSNTVAAAITMPASPSGLALAADGALLYVTCAASESTVCVVDVAKGIILASIPVGHTARAPVLGLDGKTLYVCNQFNNSVSVVDLPARRERARVTVQREPVAADITKDGKYLLVANHLSAGCSDTKNVAAVVSVIDLSALRVVKELNLPPGSEMLKDLRVAPNGKFAVLTHIFCNYDLPTRRVDLGLMNANAMTIIDLSNIEPLCTFLLDAPEAGAGNPWGVAWSSDGSELVVAHAGTQEVSIIDFPSLLAGLPADQKAKYPSNASTSVLKFVPHYEDEELNNGLPFLVGARVRVKLPSGDLGPRAVAIVGRMVYAANYFSDTLSAIDTSFAPPRAVSVPLGDKKEMKAARKGEFYFHDADLCFQGWQSCASCHPGDGRVDGLNWKLVTSGAGHPKNTRSLLLADRISAPAGLGVPDAQGMGPGATAATAIRVAIKSLLFTNLPEEIALDMEAYVRSLQPVPSPFLSHGGLSKAAQHGKALFSQAGCVKCHRPGLFTDARSHDVGTASRFDASPEMYTPSLIEVWRTAPYLHDGSAATIREVLTTRNPKDGRHGHVSSLTSQELDDLSAYVLSL